MHKIVFIATQPPQPLNSGFAMRIRGHLDDVPEDMELLKIYPDSGEETGFKPDVSFSRGRVSRFRELFSSTPRILLNYRDSAERTEVMKAISRMEPDAVIVSGIHVMPLVPHGSTVIYDAHNVEWQLSAGLLKVKGISLPVRLHRYMTFRKLRLAEERTIRDVDHVLACSETDAAYFAKLRGSEVPVVRNGVDPEFWRITRDPEPGLVLFSGDMSYYPNIDAATYLVGEVLPVLRSRGWSGRIVLCGKDPAPEVLRLASPQVEVTGFVPDMRPYYAKAAALAAPMRIGSGTPLKVITGMAAGVPVVTNSRVATSLGLESAGCFSLAESPADFARGILEVTSSQEMSSRLSSEAREAVQERFSWKACSRDFWNHVNGFLREFS